MNIAVEFDIDMALVKRAVRCYARDWLSRYFAWPAALAITLAASIFWRADGLLTGLIAGFTLATYVLPLLTMRFRLRRALQEAAESGLHQRWTFGDDGVTIETSLVSVQMRWPMIKRMIKGRGVWLLVLSERKYYALPAAVFDGDALQLIAAKIVDGRPPKR